LSVFHSDVFTDVPHFGKYTVEWMIEGCNLPATILQPNYFMQNDASMKVALLGKGVYPRPIGNKGVSMVDARDIAEAAALCLLERENAAEPLPREKRSPASGPRRWADKYGGDDLAAFENQFVTFAQRWKARDMRLMFGRFHQEGMAAQLKRSDGSATCWATSSVAAATLRPRRRNSGKADSHLTFVCGQFERSASRAMRGLCPACSTLMHRRVTLARMHLMPPDWQATVRQGQERLRACDELSLKCDLDRTPKP
jgi:hypothetical protein